MPLRHAAGHAVASALARVGGNAYADDAHADWVLWTVPRARGRILYDSRIELIRRADIERISRLQSVSGNYGRTLEGVNVIVAEPAIARSFEQVHWGRVVYSDSRTVVFVRR